MSFAALTAVHKTVGGGLQPKKKTLGLMNCGYAKTNALYVGLVFHLSQSAWYTSRFMGSSGTRFTESFDVGCGEVPSEDQKYERNTKVHHAHE